MWRIFWFLKKCWLNRIFLSITLELIYFALIHFYGILQVVIGRKGLFYFKLKISTKIKVIFSLFVILFIFGAALEVKKSSTDTFLLSSDQSFLNTNIQEFNLAANTFESYLTDLGVKENFLNNLAENQKKLASFAYIKYRVKKGDTLFKIARKFDVKVDDLIVYNDLGKQGLIRVGEVIKVPGISELKRVRAAIYAGKYVQAQTYLAGIYIPVSGFNWGELHNNNGTDIAASCGTSVYAAKSGIVILSQDGWNSGYGNLIKIQHKDGTVTLYAHLLKRLVEVSDYVDVGSIIGFVGNTGHVYGKTGCHLHFEVRGGVNPLLQ